MLHINNYILNLKILTKNFLCNEIHLRKCGVLVRAKMVYNLRQPQSPINEPKKVFLNILT